MFVQAMGLAKGMRVLVRMLEDAIRERLPFYLIITINSREALEVTEKISKRGRKNKRI